MERNTDEGTWEFEINDELVVSASHPATGAVVEQMVVAKLAIDDEASSLRLHVAQYEHVLKKGATRLAPPIEAIEAFANQPRNAVALLDRRVTADTKFLPMVITGAKAAGKKSNWFYAMVLIHKRTCENAGLHYAERIARDNQVTAAVVHRWVAEAKRRGITMDDDEDGQIRIDGVPMNMSGEPMDVAQPLKAAR